MTPSDLKGKHLLPNLNLNIRVGNSIVNIEDDLFSDNAEKINEITKIKEKFYKSEDYDESKKLLKDIFTLENQLNNKLIETSKIKDQEKIKPFNYDIAFCDIMLNGGFDAVVGNPPYLREKGHKEVFDSVKLGGCSKYLQGKMDFWYLFLCRAIDVAKTNARIGFITNSYFLKGSGASKLIAKIKAETVMECAVNFEDLKIFQNVSGKHIIHIYSKQPAGRSNRTKYIKIDKSRFSKYSPEIVGQEISLPYKKIFDGKKISFDIDLVDYKHCKKLGPLYNISQGIVEASDKISNKMLKKVKDISFKAGEGIFVISENEKKKLKLTNDEKKIIKKYIDTNDVEKYRINYKNKYLIYSNKINREKIEKNNYPNIKKHLDKMKKFITSSNKPYGLHRPREWEDGSAKYFESEKLICVGMFDKPAFVYDDNRYYVGMSFSVIIEKDKKYSLKYLLGILNSKFGEYWFKKHGKDRGVGVDIGVGDFRSFPVYPATIEEQKEVIKIVDELTAIKGEMAKDLKVEKKEKLILDFNSKEVELNECICKVFKFTPEELEIIKNATM